MKCHYKIQTIFETHTHTCTALCTKLLYHLSTAVNVLPFQLLLCCTFYSTSDISQVHHKLYLYGLDELWFCQQRQDMFLSTKTSRRALAPTQPLPDGYHRLLPPGYSRGSIKLTTHLHLMPGWMSRAIRLLLLLAFVVRTT